MRIPRRNHLLVVTLLLCVLIVQTSIAGADAARRHRLKNPITADHTPPSGNPSSLVADNFDVLGHSNLGGGSPHGDVAFFDHEGAGKHAYVGTWSGNCSGVGAKIVDVNDPSRPKRVAYVGGRTGVSNEDLVVQRIGTRDVLAIGVQPCKGQGLPGGLALFDVTDPSNPESLSFTEFPFGVHELDMVVRGDGVALALLAVPFTEFENQYFGADLGGEFKIVDVTDPAAPDLLADWGYIADSSIEIVAGNDEVSSSFQGIGDYAAYYAHSARAADDGMTAYVSYWDGGILKFDISDPDEPELVGRTTYPLPADGDGHSLTVYDAGGTRYILQNDEDGVPYTPPVVTSSATGTTEYQGIEEPWMPQLLTEVGPVSGEVFDAGDGCEASDFAGAAGKIALVDVTDPFYVGIIPGWELPCTIGSQVLRAIRAGADGVLSNLISPDDAWPFFRSSSKSLRAIRAEAPDDFVVVQISDIDELADEIRAAAGTVDVTLTPSTPTHGFLRIFNEVVGSDTDGDGAIEWTQVGSFDDLPYVSGTLDVPPGTWNIHNTEVHGNRAYSAWMSHGIVALDLSSPTAPTEAGQFVPPTSSRFAGSLGVGPPAVWGVAIDPETGIVYASDMRTGLWIVQPTGPAAPSG